MAQLRVDDVELHVSDSGIPGERPPLVLLHGLGGSHEDWEHQIPHFAQHQRVVAPDLRGFGSSPVGTRRIGIVRLATDVAQLLDALGIERCQLVGHSMGGAVALQFALTHPDRVDRMVIANSVPSFQPRSARHYIEFLYRLTVMGLLGPARLAEIGAMRMFPGDDFTEQRARLIARGRRNTRAVYLGALASLSRWGVIERLGELKMPVLVAASEHDYFGHEETVKFAHALPRGRLHTFKDAHHGLPMERPQAFNAVVERFLRGAAPRASQDKAA